MRKSAKHRSGVPESGPRLSFGEGDPPEEAIRKRAYEVFLGRGGAPGHEVDDWLQAERELRAERLQGVPD